MKPFSYNIVSKRIPIVRLSDKSHQNHLIDNTLPVTSKRSRVIDTDCLSCEYVSDGSTVIKLSELVKKLREHKEIKLYPLTLCVNENLTEHYAADEGEGFSAVTIHVDVQTNAESMIPTKIVLTSEYGVKEFAFQNNKIHFDTGSCVLIQLYPVGDNRNCIEISTNCYSEYDLKDCAYFVLVPKIEYGIIRKLMIFGESKGVEYMVYELESTGLQQNQKITVLNYLK